MKIKEITTKSDKELTVAVNDLRKKIIAAEIDLRTKEVKNVKTIHNLKRDLARALTIKRQRAIIAEEVGSEKSNG